jgi:hypothetical protein
MHTKFLSLKGKGNSEDLDIDARIILKYIWGNCVAMSGLDSCGSG